MPSLLDRWAALLGLDPEDLALLLAVCFVLGSMSAADTIGGAAAMIGAGTPGMPKIDAGATLGTIEA